MVAAVAPEELHREYVLHINRDLTAGGAHSLALRSDGTVVAWGVDGDGYPMNLRVPTDLSGVVAIAAGACHDIVLRDDGSLVAWGNNAWGQANIPPGLSGVKSLVAGYWHNLVLKDDGTVFGWGYDQYGQATGGTGLGGVGAIASGGYHSTVLQKRYPLSVTLVGNGSVSAAPTGGTCTGGTCSWTYDHGTLVTLTATNNVKSWSGACSGAGRTCQINIVAAASVTVAFQK